MIRRFNTIALSIAIATVVAVLPAMAGTSPAIPLKPQTTCPVMGGEIDKAQYVDYQGKRIYVCCGGCKAEVVKSPMQYIAKIEAAGQSVEVLPVSPLAAPETGIAGKHLQTLCPVLGNPIDKKLFVDYKGKRIYVCCAMCILKVKANPAKYLRKIEKSGESVELISAAKTGKQTPAKM